MSSRLLVGQQMSNRGFHDLSCTSSDALPLSYRRLVRARSLYQVERCSKQNSALFLLNNFQNVELPLSTIHDTLTRYTFLTLVEQQLAIACTLGGSAVDKLFPSAKQLAQNT